MTLLDRVRRMLMRELAAAIASRVGNLYWVWEAENCESPQPKPGAGG